MRLGFVLSHCLSASRHWRPMRYARSRGAVVVALAFVIPWLATLFAAPSASAQEQPAQPSASTLRKFVILSRHGVRSPIPSLEELETWTTSKWPTWMCDGKECDRGQLTPQGRKLAEQMGTYYRRYLADILPADQCPAASEVFFWADLDERTRTTGRALLRGFRPSSCDNTKYFHTATPPPPDRVFHPVTSDGLCKLDADFAEAEIYRRAGGDFPTFIRRNNLGAELSIAQKTLQCCQSSLCQTTWNKTCRLPPPAPNTCTLPMGPPRGLPSCVVRRPETGTPTRVELGGALRVASTFSELLLLEYANGFPLSDVGWGRITRDELSQVLRLHTTVVDLEQRTPTIAKRQGSMLLRKILLALQGRNDNTPGTAPPDAKFVAYVGHDTNISNIAAMLGLSWHQPGYQKDETPPAGAVIFELHQLSPGSYHVAASYLAQSLDDMRNASGASPVRTAVPIPGCGNGDLCPLENFANLVEQALDPDCSMSAQVATHDFNRDGRSDILWRNGGGGVALWMMSSASILSAAGIGSLPTNWSVAGLRDMNADGFSDILWSADDGGVALWLMSGATIKSAVAVGSLPGGWTIAGTGDFNADSIGDILLRHTSGAVGIWFMNSDGTVASSVGVGSVPVTWTIAGTGDFNADGIADILWSDTTGGIALWLMNSNGTLKSAVGVGSLPVSSWAIAGTGDFNGDGISDILFHCTCGGVGQWLMNSDGTIMSALGVGSATIDWSIVQTGDFNGDGKSDILWHNSDGGVALWLMNSNTISSALGVGSVIPDWQIQRMNSD